jgi:hypothetical protein
LEKIMKKFDLRGIQTHPILLNPHGLKANRTSPKSVTRRKLEEGSSLIRSFAKEVFKRNLAGHRWTDESCNLARGSSSVAHVFPSVLSVLVLLVS